MGENKIIYVVTYLDDSGRPTVTAFDNEENANKCYQYFKNKYHTEIDKCKVYSKFVVEG